MKTAILWIFVGAAAVIAACSSSDNNNNGYATGGAGGGTATGGAAGSTATGGAAGSTETGGAAGNAGQTADSGPAASFTEVYTTIISQRCTPCHTTSDGIGVTSGKLDMTSQAKAYSDLVNAETAGAACAGKGPRVKPGEPDSSIMYLKVSLDDPSPCGSKMPLGLPPLTQDEVDKIESWIKAGAPND